jgi:hypothetical protein
MNVHLDLHEAQVRFARRCLPCTEQMHVHPDRSRMNVHPVLHLHDKTGTM